jgi:hypothetical protein
MASIHPSSRTIATKLDITNAQYLVFSHFNEGWLVVCRGLKAMEVHYGGGDIGKPRGLNVSPEFHSGVQTRASNGNWDLQVLWRR